MTATLWDTFVASGGRDAALLSDKVTHSPGELAGFGQVAFRIALSCLGIGAEPVGKLAISIERAIDRAAAMDGHQRQAMVDAVATLNAAFVQLANPDKSGARVEDLPLGEVAAALDAAIANLAAGPAIAGPPTPPRFVPPAPAAVAPAAGTFVWAPAVDEDMVELFFDEATERLEALAGKLVEIERRPEDVDLLRDIFRDLHTVKGSSAMVGLKPVNDLAHAAEDLVGQIRDSGRAPDSPVIDALLAALDGLRDMLGIARARGPIAYDPSPVIARLRNPGAPVAAAVSMPKPATPGPAGGAPHGDGDRARPTIRVDFEKLDRLLNLVGELVLGRDELRGAVSSLASVTAELARAETNVGSLRGIARKVSGAITPSSTNRGLDALGDELSRVERVLGEVTTDLDHGTDRLDAISGELREQVMRLRMVPVTGVFRKHVRTVRDLAANLGKRARLELVGEDTELDKLLVEALDEPLMHLVRNSVDHGLEPPEGRAAAGKPAEGVVTLSAAHRGNQVEIRVSDDGRGLDPEKLKTKALERGLISEAEANTMSDREANELIFRAGFSTAAQVTEVSGRGVGMDIVRATIVTKLKGTIDVESTIGQGSAFVLKLPLTLAIIQVVVARAGGETFAIPLDIVQRVLSVKPSEITLVGDREVVVVRGKHVPVIRLDAVLELDSGSSDAELPLVLVEQSGESYALVCEHLVGKREIVIKSLGNLLVNVPCVAGATLLGDRVALILDVPAIIRRALEQPSMPRPTRPRGVTRAAGSASHILLVEDSDIVRESLRRILVDAGYVVTVAIDGQHGLELARSRKFDLVSTDVMMPRMDGYELTRALRAMPEYADIPIVMVTSMGERIDRVRGFDAGVDEYITKPHDRTQLVRAVRKLLGHGDGE
jgi:two-component system, chemotaxis family, sensor kinase CheA